VYQSYAERSVFQRILFTIGARNMGGMDAQQLKRLKELEEENRRLKRMYADIALDNQMLKDVLSKKW
jgi:putative transposase